MNDVEKSVIVPLLQAGISGCLAGALAGSGCALWEWEWAWAGVVGCVVTLAAWLYFRAEVKLRADVQAGVVQVQAQPAQPEPVQAFELAVTYNEGAAGDILQFGVDPERFRAWCSGVADGRSLAQAGWIGRGGLFSRSEYTRLMAELLNRGYIRLRCESGHAQGYELVAKGRALVNGAARAHAHARTHSTGENARGVAWPG